jgi:hypothetical protein
MVVTKGYIQRLRVNARLSISPELEQILIDRLGEEPEPYMYSEQDIHEQTRKIINRYQTPRGRLELLYELDKLEGKLEALHSVIARELLSGRETDDDF